MTPHDALGLVIIANSLVFLAITLAARYRK